jgi:energy-coupling factor transporter ATP-binding protein EcfA2
VSPPLSALDTALQALELGLSPVPPVEDGSKRPLADIEVNGEWTWKPYQTTPATVDRVREWFASGRKSIGLATGVMGLECLEFDDRDTYDAFLEAATEAGLGDLVNRVRAGYEEFTPGGGVHWLYFCDERRGNTKLAERPIPGTRHKKDVLIETRGEGGFIIIAPSNGKVHPSGGAYKLVCGQLTTISTLLSSERDELWELARTFDEIVKEPEADPENDPLWWAMGAELGSVPTQGVRPGDDFARRTTWDNILEAAGWVKVFTRRDTVYWRRPGKDRGVSATTGHCKGLKVFTTSTPFATTGTYTKLGAYAALNYDGSFREAVRNLARTGYGTWIDDDGKEHQNPPAKDWRSKQAKSGDGPAARRSAQTGADDKLEYAALSDDDLGMIAAQSVKETPINWLWLYRLAAGEMALTAGEGGVGKSTLLLALGALITTGGEWPDGSGTAPVGDVIIVSAEDSRETTLKPRLMALGADLARVKFVTANVTIQKPNQPPMVHPMTLQDIQYWKEILRRTPDCKMLIIDPLPSYLGRSVNDAKNSELRAVIEPFIDQVIRPAGVCFIANTYLNKNVDSKTLIHRITGSAAYGNLPRNVHFVFSDPDNVGRMFFKQTKCNNAPRDLPAIAYSLDKAIIPSAAGPIETSVLIFEKATVHFDLQKAIAPPPGKRGPTAHKTPRVALWLLEHLRAAAGPTAFRDVLAAAGAMGFVGEYKADNQGRMRWSIPAILYQAKDAVPALEAPNNGWIIETITGGGVFWRAIQS